MVRTIQLAFAVLLAARGSLGQDPASAPPPPPTQAAPAAVPAPAPTGPPKLEYTGRPLTLPYTCTEEEIQQFGLSCSKDDPCPLYLELSDVEAVGNSLFLSGNIHNEATTLFSILLSSEDGGRTWIEAAPRHRFTVIDQIQFIDFQNGWVAGQTIQTVPKDPFLLITSDGGRTWRKRPLFEEGRVGAIEQFHFDSKTSGALLLDRSKSGEPHSKFEYYESQTGGESWTLREVSSRTLRPKRLMVARPPSDWRLRADAAIKSYRLERQTAGRWQTVASFQIRTAECVPPVPPPPPPAEQTEPPEPVKPAVPATPPSLKKKQY